MKVIDILRLLRKHIVLLLGTPVLLAVLVSWLTKNPAYTYSSETTLYTGIASGSSVEMDKSFNYYAANNSFDNLINIIKSRETQQQVAIRLLAQHLMMKSPDPRFLSKASFQGLHSITPAYIFKLVVHEGKETNEAAEQKIVEAMADSVDPADSLIIEDNFSFSSLDTADPAQLLPPSIDPLGYAQTIKNLEAYMASSDTNFVYKLLNFSHPNYSIKAISALNVTRIASSDLVKLKFESDDPGICRMTLVLFTEVCIKNFKSIKENRSDAVVRYFEHQLKMAAERLKIGEDKLLKFNEDNNIINYYEQSKAVAVVKEELDIDYNKMKIKLAGTAASIKRIEEKLGNQQSIQLKSASVVQKRNQLGDVVSKIATAETIGFGDTIRPAELAKLKASREKLKEEITDIVNDLYSYNNSTEGLPVDRLLSDWIANVIDYEDTKAGMGVLADRIVEFQKQYEIYAPAGANIKRIEREINVSEQEFLQLLHGLNLAKLKMQDVELSSNIKAVDLPFFPLSPNPTKRKMLVIIAALFGFLIVLTTMLALEYFDATLKNPEKAHKKIKLMAAGIFPKIIRKTGSLNFAYVTNRLLEIILQSTGFYSKDKDGDAPHTLLFFSTLNAEGKTVIAGNMALKMKIQGKKVLFLNYSRESLRETELSQIGYLQTAIQEEPAENLRKKSLLSYLPRLLGYPDKGVNYDSPFLQPPETYLTKEEYMEYKIDAGYYSAMGYEDLVRENNYKLSFKPDYVLIELPPVLYYQYPANLLASAGTPFLVCRANRVWSQADEACLDNIIKLTRKEPYFLLNGVDLFVIETVLGDLPKKRSRFRRLVKNIARFRFFSRQKF